VSQVVECLPGKCEALSSNSSTTNKKSVFFVGEAVPSLGLSFLICK
jgi:hypothetical protein